MQRIPELVEEFFLLVGSGEIEIYNEISLQHEVGCYLRRFVATGYKIQFERPVSFYDLDVKSFLKKEIDISIFTPNRSRKAAIELKFPRNGQYPEQMFEACRDIAFLEQLMCGGFESAYFVLVAEDSLFYRGGSRDGIYAYFRGQQPLKGTIRKPIGATSSAVEIKGSYSIQWRGAESVKHCLIEIASGASSS